ncbi:hypothetical protein [Paenibacillus koleovorans]|uniref:hypothetical protein n=1 Tax=Paenibacillus koleovorans TaxID=121608 RepID=UPI000FD887B5|nr:hypothetical protein [Paenibacillus koleovorans]
MTTLLTLIVLAGILVVVLLFRRRRMEPESFLTLKLIGCLVLGAFTLTWSGEKWPLGFVLFVLLFIRLKRNGSVKWAAAITGFMLYMAQIVYPWAENAVFEQSRHLAMPVMQLDMFGFAAQWKLVSGSSGVSSDVARMETFELVFGHDGSVRRVLYEVVEPSQDGFVLYKVDYKEGAKAASVSRKRLGSQWLQYANAMEAGYFFERLDDMELSVVRPAGEYPFRKLTLHENGASITYSIADTPKFVIYYGGMTAIRDTQLPVQGHWLSACGLTAVEREGPYSPCDNRSDYIFDVEFIGSEEEYFE